ncbi:EF-Tu/IF-2/RF-3 family GTPase, partial [Thermus sp.]|uniref:EF-Tu/IF-2/RF-3 family GTPase n=1 Tax=Thermus sp. TaxID=275 RepID=UPI003D116790
GDLRLHGPRADMTREFVRRAAAEKPVALVCEGTRVSDEDPREDLSELFQAILEHVPPPRVSEGPFQLLVANLDHSPYLGRVAIGRVFRGRVHKGQEVVLLKEEGAVAARVAALYTHEGLERIEVAEGLPGDIVALAGLEGAEIGDTVAAKEAPEALPRLRVDEPTVALTLMANTSPFSGREGKHVTGQKLRERLFRELRTNVALQVEEVAPEVFELRGRGELHLAILLETMRREGYEFGVGQPRVLVKGGLEPYELLVVEVPTERLGGVMEALGARRAEMVHMEVGERVRAEFVVPARALFGFRSLFLSLTGGEGVLSHTFHGYGAQAGPIPTRTTGSAVAMEAGVATAYSLHRLQERVAFFIEPGAEVYVGMIVGAHVRENDLDVNVTIAKKLTNVRAAGSDENLRLIPPRRLSLEEALEFLAEDELLEVTPKSLRLRKKVLDPSQRKRLVGK